MPLIQLKCDVKVVRGPKRKPVTVPAGTQCVYWWTKHSSGVAKHEFRPCVGPYHMLAHEEVIPNDQNPTWV